MITSSRTMDVIDVNASCGYFLVVQSRWGRVALAAIVSQVRTRPLTNRDRRTVYHRPGGVPWYSPLDPAVLLRKHPHMAVEWAVGRT
eukprot:COSAG01_NODE_2388_length_7779_cov_127.916384_6_plen_87_part_00